MKKRYKLKEDIFRNNIDPNIYNTEGEFCEKNELNHAYICRLKNPNHPQTTTPRMINRVRRAFGNKLTLEDLFYVVN